MIAHLVGYYCFMAAMPYYTVKRIFSILHWLNFDTALGAVITSLFIGRELAAGSSTPALAALFLVVLSIYNFDHLLDAQRIRTKALSGRHRFYQDNFKVLSIYQVLLLLALLVVSWFVPPAIAQPGVILAVVALIYFLLLFIILQKKFLLKEFFISMVYVAGLVLAPVVLAGHQANGSDYLLWLEIFLLAFSNTIILSWFDHDLDAREGHASLSQLIGAGKTYKLGYSLLATVMLLVVSSLILYGHWPGQLIILAMGGVLLATLAFHRFFRRNEVFRFVIDAIFIIPVITLIAYA